METPKDFLWVERYRPKTVNDIVLPARLKQTFKTFVDEGTIPNLILNGSAGVGKTTVARAMIDELDADCMLINGSLNASIDRLRTDVEAFASTMSFKGGRKYIILDEADNMHPSHIQPALRNFMEKYSNNCGFILTSNYVKKIIEPLQSRCAVVDFRINKDERAQVASHFFKRVCSILDGEGVEYDKKSVAELIQVHFPDWRRVINELQRYSSSGRIDSGILVNHSHERINELIDHLKTKNFTKACEWVEDNSDLNGDALYTQLYEVLPPKLSSASAVAELTYILADYMHKEAFAANPVINRVAALSQIMAKLSWK